MPVAIKERPRLSLEEALGIAQRAYGLSADATELPSERDQNFLLAARSGDKYVLKIANSGEDRRLLDMQNQAMSRLSERVRGSQFQRNSAERGRQFTSRAAR